MLASTVVAPPPLYNFAIVSSIRLCDIQPAGFSRSPCAWRLPPCASAKLPFQLSRLPCKLSNWRACPWQAANSGSTAPASRTVRMAVVGEPLEVLVKAASGQPDQLGDCPFSQRVLLTLEEKGIPYNAKFVDTENKPAWFLEANPEGKVPVIKHEGSWVADSDVITKLVEEKYPGPSLSVSEDKLAVGSKLFGAFVKFLKSKDSSDGSEEALVEELKALNEYLKLNGPYVGGEKISSVDLSLAPKLYHLKIALGHYKQWSIPQDLSYLLGYVEDLHSRESFQKTVAPAPVVVKGWSKHFA